MYVISTVLFHMISRKNKKNIGKYDRWKWPYIIMCVNMAIRCHVLSLPWKLISRAYFCCEMHITYTKSWDICSLTYSVISLGWLMLFTNFIIYNSCQFNFSLSHGQSSYVTYVKDSLLEVISKKKNIGENYRMASVLSGQENVSCVLYLYTR